MTELKMDSADKFANVLLITANIGSIFEDVSVVQKIFQKQNNKLNCVIENVNITINDALKV